MKAEIYNIKGWVKEIDPTKLKTLIATCLS